MLEIGIKGTATLSVTEDKLAKHVGSGTVALLSSPIMIALMEEACWRGCVPYHSDKECTVGISVNVKHMRATPLGMTVTANATLTEIKGARLFFDVTASDDLGEIGAGTHVRVLVEQGPFEDKAYGR